MSTLSQIMFEQNVKKATKTISEIMKSGESFKTLKKIREEIKEASRGQKV